MIDQLEKFVAAGNTFQGPPPQCDGAVKLSWVGSDNHLVFGEGVKLVKARIKFLGRGGKIAVGSNTQVKGDLIVNKKSTLTIGDNTFLNRVCDIRAMEGADITIGSDCLFSNVGILTSDLHSILDLQTGKRSNPAQSIVIEDNVWLSENVKIAKGARIGAGAVISAGSIVTSPIAPYCIGAGRPARVIRAGVSWDRSLHQAAPKPARPFKGTDIPLNQEVYRQLNAAKRYDLLYAAIDALIEEGTTVESLPVFAQWYFVFCRHKLNKSTPEDKQTLENIMAERPKHKAARKLYDEFFSQ